MKNLTEQAQNKFTIVGKLMDVTIRSGFTKDKRKYESANMTIRVQQTYNGQTEISEIPVSLFAPEFTNTGAPHPGFRSIQEIKTWKSIQDYGEVEATRVRMTAASIRENNFVTRSGQLVNSWQISTPFLNQANATNDIATFTIEMFIMDMHDEMDREGTPTGRLIVKGGIVQYGGVLDVLEFVVEDPNCVDYISRNFNVNDTARFSGRVRITSKEVNKAAEHSSWGESLPDTTTQMLRELVITTGADDPYDEEFAYDSTEIKKAFNERKARIEQLQINAKQATPKADSATSKYSWE